MSVADCKAARRRIIQRYGKASKRTEAEVVKGAQKKK